MICPRCATSLVACPCWVMPGDTPGSLVILTPAQRKEFQDTGKFSSAKPKRIGIIGSRRRDTYKCYYKILAAFKQIYVPGDTVVSGGCKQGGDRFAEQIARAHNIKPILHLPGKPDPDLMKINPRVAITKANYARNGLIARDSDVIIASMAKDRTGGTENTLKTWKKLHPGQEPILV